MPTGLKIHRGVFFQFHHFECLINNKKQEVPESFTTAYTCTKYVCRWNAYCSGGSSGWAQQGKQCRHCWCWSGFLTLLHRYPYEKPSLSPGNTESLNPQEAQSQRQAGQEVWWAGEKGWQYKSRADIFSEKKSGIQLKEWYWQKLEPVPGVSRKVEVMLGEKRKSQVQETDWRVIIYQNQLPVSANSFQYPACCHFLHMHLQLCSFPSIL